MFTKEEKDPQRAYNRYLRDYIERMASQMVDTAPLSATTVAEDSVSRWLNGGNCTTTSHIAASTLEKLLMLKFLRMDMPHQSTQISDLEAAIKKEATK